jgi:hypothetical protein
LVCLGKLRDNEEVPSKRNLPKFISEDENGYIVYYKPPNGGERITRKFTNTSISKSKKLEQAKKCVERLKQGDFSKKRSLPQYVYSCQNGYRVFYKNSISKNFGQKCYTKEENLKKANEFVARLIKQDEGSETKSQSAGEMVSLA